MNNPTTTPIPPASRWRWLGLALNIAGFISVVGILFYFGVPQFKERLAIVKPITFVGHSDDAAYAIMGDSLLHGRGLQVNYISFFFIPYDQNITRREDHWPPFMGFAIAPCFYLWGKAAWVAKLPAIAFGSLGLPLAAALLAFALSRRGYVAIIAGLLMMAHPYIYEQSLRTLSDVSTAMLIAAFAGSLLLAQRYQWMHLLAGTFAALAFYSKGSEFILLGLYPPMALLSGGWRSFKSGWLYAGLLTALLLMAPFLYSNYKLFGDPLHSTQNYVSGYFSFEDWETGTYLPYWGHNPPKTSDRWTKYASAYWRSSAEQMETLARTSLTGLERAPDVWGDFGGWGYRARDFFNGEWARAQGTGWLAHLFGWTGRIDPKNINLDRRRSYLEKIWDRPVKPLKDWQFPAWELPAVGAALLCLWVLLTLPWALYVWIHRRLSRYSSRASVQPLSAIDHPQRRLLIGPVAAVCLLFAVQFIFLSYFWAIRSRFAFTFLPLLAALGITSFAHFAELPFQAAIIGIRSLIKRRRPGLQAMDALLPYWHVLLTIAFALTLLIYAKPLQARYADWQDANMQKSGYPFEDEPGYPTIGKWVNKTIPTAIIMSRNPWEITFYSPASKGITFPNPEDTGAEGAEQIFAIARYYHVTHILMDDPRESLFPYMEGQKPGLKRIRGAPGPFFEIDWSKIPPNWTIQNAFPFTTTATKP